MTRVQHYNIVHEGFPLKANPYLNTTGQYCTHPSSLNLHVGDNFPTQQAKLPQSGQGRCPCHVPMLSEVQKACPNQRGDHVAGQSLLGKEISLSRYSANASSAPRAASSLAVGFPTAPASRNGRPISSSRESASRTRAPSTRSTVPSSASEFPNPVAKEPEANMSGLQCGFGSRGSSRRGTSRFVPTTSENGHDRSERRSLNFSSGDGLGIQQPGSMTRGFASQRQPASGRARDRAMCPAVARFDRRAA